MVLRMRGGLDYYDDDDDDDDDDGGMERGKGGLKTWYS